MVCQCLNVFWFSKDNPTGHTERQKMRYTEEKVGIQFKGLTNSAVISHDSQAFRNMEMTREPSASSLIQEICCYLSRMASASESQV